MADTTFYKDRWVDIEPDKLDNYQRMFQWNPGSRVFYDAADIREGHTVGELGSGPGHTAVEIARWVGASGRVYALDINESFVAQTRDNARNAGVEDQVFAQQCDGTTLPIPDACLDRVTARNTLIYVDDVEQTLREFKRVLKPGGLAHAIDGDWPMMVIEPLPAEEWAAIVKAASHACRTPNIGRILHGMFVKAGFENVSVQLLTRPDTEGRLLGMVKNMVGYARASGTLSDATIDKTLESIDNAILQKTYLALAPQFVVTARV